MKKLLLCGALALTPFLLQAQCNNLTDGGVIGPAQGFCEPFDPDPILDIQTPSGGSGNIEYMWLKTYNPSSYGMSDSIPGAHGASFNPGWVTQTTWFVRCARRSGCTNWVGEAMVEITVECIYLDLDATDIGCGLNNTGELDITAWGGFPPYTYYVNGATSSPYLFNLAAGTYVVTVEDAMGCTVTDSVTVTSSGLTLNTTVVDVPCSAPGDYAIVNASGGVGPYTFQWSNGANGSYLSGSSNLLSGAYVVVVTDQSGCQASDTVIFDSGAPAKASMECCQDTVVCEGSSVDFQVDLSGDAPWLLTWTDGINTYTDSVFSSPYYISLNPVTTTTIELLSVSNGCSTGSACGGVTVAVENCTCHNCMDGCHYSWYEMTPLSGGCYKFQVFVQANGCDVDLEDITIGVSCGDISGMDNNWDYNMQQTYGIDPITGLSGIQVEIGPGYGYYQTLEVVYTLCPGACGEISNCAPIIAYHGDNCISYEQAWPEDSLSLLYGSNPKIEITPNPFKENCMIYVEAATYSPNYYGQPYILITDLGGRRVRYKPINAISMTGERFTWNGCNDQGRQVEPGTYVVTLVRPGYGRQRSVKVVKQ